MTTQLLDAARILLVEDEFLIAMDVEQLCRDHGAEKVRIIGNKTELDAFRPDSEEIDAAILDVKIAGNWTVEFARMLQRNGIPFIFATGYSELASIFEEFAGVRVVGKPYAGTEIVEALAATLAEAPSLRNNV